MVYWSFSFENTFLYSFVYIHVCTINVFIIHESCTIIIKTPLLIGYDVRFYVFVPLYQDQNLIFKPDNDLILHKIFIKIISRLEKYDLHATPKRIAFLFRPKKNGSGYAVNGNLCTQCRKIWYASLTAIQSMAEYI